MIEEKYIGEFELLLYTGPDAEKLWASLGDDTIPAPDQLYTWAETRGADGLIWESLEQFWGDYGMVQMELGVGKMAVVAKSLYEANKPDPFSLARSLGIEPEDLDDLVHDLISRIASTANNDGLESQIGYMINSIGEIETVETLRKIAKDKV